ncbi:Pcc1-domain-containing protein [Ophiocordyceps camponoti-floridani]|uniref:Pcc1-domain-containing protein n=1 Tax=Ophiocordyceps camponoti-floridani TaxID=2030778 RepID=A0A8H4QBW6_9HYPO|nr:Pcc1-domain-containing protein [Ophiocordyceps camponoti-floridani]
MPSPDFPYSLTIRIPLPSQRLAETALKALVVDEELSPLVRRSLAVERHILVVDYDAATNRMLRVAVNSFLDNVKVVLHVMQLLDVDVLQWQSQLSSS